MRIKGIIIRSIIVITLCVAAILLTVNIRSLTSIDDNLSSDSPSISRVTKPKQKPSVLQEYKKLYKQNNDLVGFITIPNTNINYPVMQNANDNEYYMRKDINKRYSLGGLPFADNRSSVNPPSDNIIIYGHNMEDSTMFSDILKYDDNSFYKQNPIVTFDTIYEKQQYEIVSVFYSQILKKKDNGYRFYNFINANNKEEYDEYISYVKDRSIYETNVTPKYGDKLVTLITCSDHVENGRISIVARKIKS